MIAGVAMGVMSYMQRVPFVFAAAPLLALMYSRGLQTALYGAFNTYLTPQPDAKLPERYKSSFYSYGLFGLLDEWILRGFCETPEQMAKIVTEI